MKNYLAQCKNPGTQNSDISGMYVQYVRSDFRQRRKPNDQSLEKLIVQILVVRFFCLCWV